MGKFPQLFCLQRRHLGHPNFGTWGLGNSIILVFETPLHSRFCAFMQSYPMLGMEKAMSIRGSYRQVGVPINHGYRYLENVQNGQTWYHVNGTC